MREKMEIDDKIDAFFIGFFVMLTLLLIFAIVAAASAAIGLFALLIPVGLVVLGFVAFGIGYLLVRTFS